MRSDHLKGNPARRAVWVQMSEHWLDTEARHLLPQTAHVCLASGYSIRELRDIWRYEVTPALWQNLYMVAGNWTGWEANALAALIARRQLRPARRGTWPARLVYRCRAYSAHRDWVVLESLMEYLQPLEPQQREAYCTDLRHIAAVYFEMAEHFRDTDTADIDRLRRVYEDVFLPVFRPVFAKNASSDTRSSPGAARLKALLNPTNIQ